MPHDFPDQLSLFATKQPAPQPAAVGGSLDRLTWQDDVEMGDAQTPASKLPAWKLAFKEGDDLLLRPKRAGARRVTARVIHTCTVPADFALPVLVQVSISIGGQPPVVETMIPAASIEKHLSKVEPWKPEESDDVF